MCRHLYAFNERRKSENQQKFLSLQFQFNSQRLINHFMQCHYRMENLCNCFLFFLLFWHLLCVCIHKISFIHPVYENNSLPYNHPPIPKPYEIYRKILQPLN